MDPAGDEALLLCAIVAALLGGLIVLGFGLVQAPKHSSTRRRKTTELDLVTLWRLGRSLRKGKRPESRGARVDNSVKTTP